MNTPIGNDDVDKEWIRKNCVKQRLVQKIFSWMLHPGAHLMPMMVTMTMLMRMAPLPVRIATYHTMLRLLS
jgi:hypothetical protein